MKFAKLMFLHLSVNHSVHRGGCVWLQEGVRGGGGGCVWLWGACMVVGACVVAGGMCGCGGHVWLWGDGHVWDTMRYGQ